MPDWKKVVGDRLESCGLFPNCEEVVTELAAHLEETYEDALNRGFDETKAAEYALQEMGNGRVLAEDISRAMREKEPLMSYRTMNYRTKSFWLPGLASFAAASLFLLVLTRISLQPRFLVRLNSGLGLSFYIGWLLAQVPCGALGAFLSTRAGGSSSARIAAGTFPASAMLGLWAFVIPLSALVEHNAFLLQHPLRYTLGIFVWVVPPGIALLLGTRAVPREPKPK